MSIDFPSQRQGFRHIGKLTTPYPLDVCEMWDEEECTETPAYWLTAPGSYVKPMMMCASHAKAESGYFGTPIPDEAN